MTSIQMNVRIDEELKTQGDAVFAKLGYSPTQVIRAVWGYAASKQNDLESVEKALDEAMRIIDPSIGEEQSRRIAAAEEALGIFPTVYEKLGIDVNDLPVQDSDEWIEQARYEHAVEKGWITQSEDSQLRPGDDGYARWFEIAEKMKNG
ncbi:MAG: hypothetical protein IJ111_12860 [Eggerthellaceae bacterium]|nr:hypothetical protein [Eggerthellaceae bacterium]